MKKYSMEFLAMAMALFNTACSRPLSLAIHPKTRTFSNRSNQAPNGTLDFQGTDHTDGAELFQLIKQ